MKTYILFIFLISRIHTFFLFSTSPFNLTSSSMQACSLGVQLVGQLLGQAKQLCILQTSKLDLVCHLHCITDWIIKARKDIIQQEMTQTFLYNLARLGFASSLPGLALTTYLLANHFCTTLLGLASLHPCQAWPWPRICWPTISAQSC